MKCPRSKGFTLIEIVIALAIMSIVMVSASRFLISVLNQYSKDNYDIKLQTEVEEILNLVENKVMGADGAQVTSDKELQIYFSSASEKYLFYLNDEDYYYAKDGDKSQRVYLGTHVSSVDYAVTDTAVTVNLHMSYRGVTYDASRSILLRNSAVAGTTSDLLSQIGAYINSAAQVTVNADGSLSVSDESGNQQIIRLDETAGSVKCGSTVLGTDISKLTFSKTDDKTIHVIVVTKDGQTLERDYEISISAGETQESESNAENSGTEGSDQNTDSSDPSSTEETSTAADASNSQGSGVISSSQADNTNMTTDSSSESSGSVIMPSQGESGQETVEQTTEETTSAQDQPANPDMVSVYVVENSANINGQTYCVNLQLKNNGSDILWKDMKLRYYFIGPENQTVILNALDYSLEQMGCQTEIKTMDQAYVGATEYIDLTFPNSNAVFKSGEEQSIVFSLRYDSWNNITDDGTDYEMVKSYSGQNANAVPIYYQNTLIAGAAPTTPLEKKEFSPQVTGLNCSYNSNGDACTVTVKIKNNGKSISWDDVSLRFYYVKSGREQLTLESTSYSGKKGSGNLSWSSESLSGTCYKDATDCLTVKAGNGGWFIQNEEVTLKFTMKFQYGRDMSQADSESSFANSHFLLGKEYISVYQDKTKKCGEEPEALSDNEITLEACNPVVTARNDSYSTDQKSYNISFDLQNQGQTLDLNKLEVRFFYIKPGKKNMALQSNSIKIIDYQNLTLGQTVTSTTLSDSFENAEDYVSIKPSNWDGNFYTYETIRASVTLRYGDGTVMAGGSAANRFDNSFSLQNGNTYIAVYYDGKLVSGSVPVEQSTLAVCAPVVTVNEKLDSSTSTQANIHMEIQNTGRNLDFSKLEIRYYYIVPGREKLKVDNLKMQVDGQDIGAYSSLEQLSEPVLSASNYISFKINSGSTFYTYETLSIDFTVRYESGREMFSTQFRSGFQNSYSLSSGVEAVTVYYSNSCVFGSLPPSELEILTEHMEITDYSAVLSDDKMSYKISFTLVNNGKDVSLSNVNIYFYYIKPSDTSLELLNLYNTFYGAENNQYNGLQLKSLSDNELENKYQDATRMVTFGFGSSDTFYCDEQIQVQFELKLKKDYNYVALNDMTGTYGFGKSHSLKQGSFCEVAYSGTTLYGYGPTDVMQEDSASTSTSTTTGPLPDIKQVKLNSPNSGESWNTGWADYSNSGYWYSIYLYCSNIDEIDPQEIQVCLYLYFGNKEGSTKYIYYDGSSGFSGMTYNTLNTLKGSSNWKITFNGLYFNNGVCTVQSNIRKQTNYAVAGEADLSKCYSVSADTIEIYYKGQLVWPKS